MSVLVVGSANADLTVCAPRIPGPGETVLGGDYALLPGGKGANQAVAASLAGAPVAFCGATGRDAFAPTVRRALTAAGVDMAALHALDAATGIALITVADSGENSITVAGGANARLGAEHLPDLSGVTHLLMQQEIPAGTVLEAARRARAAGVSVLLNAAPARELPAELFPLLDTLIVNEGELAALFPGDPLLAARALLARGPGAVVVTLGAAGSLAITAQETYRQPALPVTVVDTTGAGDTFCGVLAAWLAGGAALPEALRAANVAGALACTRLGAQAAMPRRAEIEAQLAHSGIQKD